MSRISLVCFNMVSSNSSGYTVFKYSSSYLVMFDIYLFYQS